MLATADASPTPHLPRGARAAGLARSILDSERQLASDECASLQRIAAGAGSADAPAAWPSATRAMLDAGIHSGLALLAQHQELSAALFSPLLEAAIGRGDEAMVLEIGSLMRRRGLAPDAETFAALIEARLRAGQPERATATCLHALDQGVLPQPRALTALVRALAEMGQTGAALELCAKLRARGARLGTASPAAEALVRAAARSAAAPFEAVAVLHELSAHGEAGLPPTQRQRGGPGVGDAAALAREAAGGRVLFSGSVQQGAMLAQCLREGNLGGARALARYGSETGLLMPAHALGALIEAEEEAGDFISARRLLLQAERRGLWGLQQRGISPSLARLDPFSFRGQPAAEPSSLPTQPRAWGVRLREASQLAPETGRGRDGRRLGDGGPAGVDGGRRRDGRVSPAAADTTSPTRSPDPSDDRTHAALEPASRRRFPPADAAHGGGSRAAVTPSDSGCVVLDLRGLPDGVARIGTLHFFHQLSQALDEHGLPDGASPQQHVGHGDGRALHAQDAPHSRSALLAYLSPRDAPPPNLSATTVAATRPAVTGDGWASAFLRWPGGAAVPSLPESVEIWADLGGADDEIRQLCARMEPPLRLRSVLPGRARAEAGVPCRPGARLVAGRADVHRWAAQVARQRLARRRGAQLGLVAVGHNIAWAGAVLVAGGLGFLM